jgi:hypothetical protein
MMITGREGFVGTLRFLWRQRAAKHLILAGAIATLWSWGLMWWTPTFLQRTHQMTLAQAGELLGPMNLIGGTAGTLLAAWLTRGLRAADPKYTLRVFAALTTLATFISIAVYWVSSTQLATWLLWLFVPAVYFYIGPILGLLQNVVPAHMRATACAVLLFLANVANLIIAPQLIGGLSDVFARAFGAGQESLRWALLLLAPTGFWAAWHFWACGRSIGVQAQVNETAT